QPHDRVADPDRPSDAALPRRPCPVASAGLIAKPCEESSAREFLSWAFSFEREQRRSLEEAAAHPYLGAEPIIKRIVEGEQRAQCLRQRMLRFRTQKLLLILLL